MFNFKSDIVNSLRAAFAQLMRSDTTKQSKDSGSLNPDYSKERGMDLKLIRQFDDGTATIGKLYLPDGTMFWSVERPWADNRVGVSCVPPGVYDLVPHASQKFGLTWALVNRSLRVVHQPGDIPEGATEIWRSAILIHTANWAKDLRGCIGPGMAFKNRSDHGPMVTSSAQAMRVLRKELGTMTRGHRIEILGVAR